MIRDTDRAMLQMQIKMMIGSRHFTHSEIDVAREIVLSAFRLAFGPLSIEESADHSFELTETSLAETIDDYTHKERHPVIVTYSHVQEEDARDKTRGCAA